MNTAPTPVLELRAASFGYAGRVVVSGVDLTVTRGESLALLGPNGCGKSTLIRGLLGLTEHIDGEIRLFGQPAAALRRRSALGYVPQRHTLSSSVVATVGEVVMIGRLPHHGLFRRPGRRDRAIVEHALEVVGLEGRAGADVTHLSGGQQRRVLVARALAAEPEILIMDEPTAGVDESNQRLLAAAMHHLASEGVTLLTVTHELEGLATAIDRVVLMQGGRVMSDSPVDRAVPASSGGGLHHLPHGRSPVLRPTIVRGGRRNA